MSISMRNHLEFLDAVLVSLQSGEDVLQAMEILFRGLHCVRRQVSWPQWRQFATNDCRQHPLMDFLQQDPLTWRAFQKPRGYPGDAKVLDFLYAVEDRTLLPSFKQCSALGKKVYMYTSNTEAAQAVRERRHIISEKIDDVARKKPQAHILSLACGHLREAISCRALREGKLGRYVAVDQDQRSLAVVAREAGSLGVETVAASVHDLLKGHVTFANLDFVYAAGLYDYLSFPIARRLTESLFAMLNPGGRMLIANFLPNRSDAGYMEAYLDWWLIYRTEADMLALSETLPARHVAKRSTFLDTHATIAFLEVLKET